ncbi:RES family NAD+ phosphorylase [Neoaquamicrobium sediminum]|uniref:RES family NAD+ phosphorylase n=1 Tax=Neoaquamicrobium sediminum TaxID=1849104 RepID=A0ABV3X0P3_9HYPH
MTLYPAILKRLSVSVDVTGYVRIIARIHAATPLGMGAGRSRFSSPRDKFRLLYLAQNPMTAVAETIVRDRYEKAAERLLHEDELDRYSIAAVRNPRPLFLLDLRNEGASLLGVSTDAVRAKAQAAGRRLSQALYDQTTFDGILYMSRITNKQCVAVYDRAVASNLEADSPALDLPRLANLRAALDALHISLIAVP